MSKNKEIKVKQQNLSNEEDEYEYEYQLVQFYNEKKTELLDIDIIPTSWTSWDRKKRACITRYPPPPYTAKVCEQLQQLVECRKPPLQRWPCWTIEIKGGANTYEQGLKRIEKLKTDTYAYTTDADGPQKSQKTTNKLMEKSIKDLLDVSDINSIDDDWTPNNTQGLSTSNSTESSDASSTNRSVNRKNSSKRYKKKIGEARNVNIRPAQELSLDNISVNPKKSKKSIGLKTDTKFCDTISNSESDQDYTSKKNSRKILTGIQTNKKNAPLSTDAPLSIDAPPCNSRETIGNKFEERFNTRGKKLSSGFF